MKLKKTGRVQTGSAKIIEGMKIPAFGGDMVHNREKYKGVCLFLALLFLLSFLNGCVPAGAGGGEQGDDGKAASFSTFGAGETVRILSGSENRELEQILEDCAKETRVNIEITYQGSIDIMRTLQAGAQDYDAVWPASSLWISLGDTEHLIKHAQSVSTTPVVFGIRKSLAQELGFTDGETKVADILEAIQSGKMTFCMTSATQSNSGASAYIGFLYALSGGEGALSEADLEDETLQEEIGSLLSGIDRSSGSSEWLMDMFLNGEYDAMVNYECLIISANQELERQGRETLYVVYPEDGLSIADSPLGYVDHGDENKEEAFLKIQDYLLSDEAQDAIQRTGRRTGYAGVSEENSDIFRADWGIDTERILTSVPTPAADVLMEALDLYQTRFKKPSLNVYCLDFSGSMQGTGNEQLVEAMSQILLQENAEKNLLQATEGEVNIVITFCDEIIQVYQVTDSSPEKLEALYEEIRGEYCGGGTDIYLAAERGLSLIADGYDPEDYTPAIILMTDGMSNGSETFADFEALYKSLGMDVPVFSILFGDAEEEQLDELAQLTNARVFDGREDLIGAFRSVKGYN